MYNFSINYIQNRISVKLYLNRRRKYSKYKNLKFPNFFLLFK